MEAPKESTGVLQVRCLDEYEDVQKIRTIMGIYYELLDIFDDISLCYGFTTLLVTCVIFLHSLTTGFVMYKEIISTGSLSRAVASSIMYVLFYAVLYNATQFICSVTETKVRLLILEIIFK